MIDINNYISEKLHIGKGYDPILNVNRLKSGDNIMMISINVSSELQLYTHFKFKKFHNNVLTIHDIRKDEDEAFNVFLNSNGYYENKQTFDWIRIFLTVDQGLEFLKQIEPDKNLNNFITTKYCDESDNTFMKDHHINCQIFSSGKIKDRVNELTQKTLS